MKRDTALTIIRSLLILLFLYASVSKIVDPALFKKQMLNQPFANWIGYILMFLVPLSEILISVFLMFDKTVKKGLIGAIILMGAFTIYTAVVLLNAFRYVPCSCGGVIQKLSWPQHLVFNLIYLGIAITGLVLQRKMQPSTRNRNVQLTS